jgi:hypothetical protein
MQKVGILKAESLTYYMTAEYIHKLYVLSKQCTMCSVWLWEQTAAISLYSINWLLFITETECVYCAVRTEYLY